MRPLPPETYRELVTRALAEDVGSGDVTTLATVPGQQRARGVFLAKSDCVIAGLDAALEPFRQLEPSVAVTLRHHDSDRVSQGEVIGAVEGTARTLLVGERVALNLLQRLSGVATLTRRFVDAARGRITVLDTRKTTPTFRLLEKYAVTAGGGTNHRVGLFDAVLIKDNHVRLAGGVAPAVKACRTANPLLSIEVETQTLDEVDQAVGAGADIILLDNMPLEQIREAVARIGGRAKTEISGGVTLDRIPALAATGATFVSVGALTHSAPAVDISFKIEPI